MMSSTGQGTSSVSPNDEKPFDNDAGTQVTEGKAMCCACSSSHTPDGISALVPFWARSSKVVSFFVAVVPSPLQVIPSRSLNFHLGMYQDIGKDAGTRQNPSEAGTQGFLIISLTRMASRLQP